MTRGETNPKARGLKCPNCQRDDGYLVGTTTPCTGGCGWNVYLSLDPALEPDWEETLPVGVSVAEPGAGAIVFGVPPRDDPEPEPEPVVRRARPMPPPEMACPCGNPGWVAFHRRDDHIPTYEGFPTNDNPGDCPVCLQGLGLCARHPGDAPDDHATLDEFFAAARARAAEGKGVKRHGGQPFDEQPILGIPRLLGSADFLLGQIIKKGLEARGLEPEAAMRECLDIANYAAAMWLWHRERG